MEYGKNPCGDPDVRAIAFGHQHFQILSQQLGSLIPKELFSLRIYEVMRPSASTIISRWAKLQHRDRKPPRRVGGSVMSDDAGQHESALVSLIGFSPISIGHFGAVFAPAKQCHGLRPSRDWKSRKKPARDPDGRPVASGTSIPLAGPTARPSSSRTDFPFAVLQSDVARALP